MTMQPAPPGAHPPGSQALGGNEHGRAKAGRQKVTFCHAEGNLLQRKTPPFTV